MNVLGFLSIEWNSALVLPILAFASASDPLRSSVMLHRYEYYWIGQAVSTTDEIVLEIFDRLDIQKDSTSSDHSYNAGKAQLVE
ncbi:unnamed protein product [Schistosoma curassoni]|uniref:ANF_receptor domain-containing protein n=1 Tax=Schistosoma curassoni TaxID=6186 RepID=A0A183K6D1_9TREM|nr:unnamed protein product [Schistosoma curassoni]